MAAPMSARRTSIPDSLIPVFVASEKQQQIKHDDIQPDKDLEFS
jgi:hypothetical protein